MELDNKILINKRVSRLSFPVILKDDYSGSSPIGKVNQYLEGRNETPIVNPSQYYVYLNLPTGDYTVLTNSEYYFPNSTPVPLHSIPIKDPVKITLKPMPSYPFPEAETLVRGFVRDSSSMNPVKNAILSYKTISRDFQTFTTGTGEFVLYFGGLKADDRKADSAITPDKTRYFVKGAGDSENLSIHVEGNGLTKDLTIPQVEVCKTNYSNITI
jgi:hypothetical protein